VVLMHAKTLLAGSASVSAGGSVSYVDADLRDVATVLAGASGGLDVTKPVALMMLGLLGYVDDFGAARSIVSQLMAALPEGSYLAIAAGVAGDADLAQQRYNQTAAAPYVLRRPDELASFFDGLDLVEPGVVPCAQWKPDGSFGEEAALAYCGVARKTH
jgi:O-methyltransferase involved in polyketide biosynthesis